MRTVNQHPEWHHQPLRLDADEQEHPDRVFHEFFNCFHLQEVRQMLWDWMVEIVTSDRIGGQDSRGRNNAIFFYEKLEELVEAAFVMHKKNNY